MIDFNENISDEALASYIDGNAMESEKSLIQSSMSDDPILSEAVDIANDATSLGFDFDWNLHKGDYGFWELGLPPVLNEADHMVAVDICDTLLNIGGEDLLDINSLDFFGSDVPCNIELSNDIENLINPNNIDDLLDIDDSSDTLLI